MWWTYMIVAVFGLIFGSFLNVVIYRTAHDESPATGRSKCPKCGHQIRWYHNIPLLSFVVLGGKCFDCKKSISWQYPIVEAMSGLLFVWWYVMGTGLLYLSGHGLDILQPIFWLMVGMCLLVIFFADLWYGIIPDGVNLLMFLLALGYRVYLMMIGAMQGVDLLTSVVAGLILMIFFYSLWAATKGRGFGGGDVKLAPALGILLGWERTLVMFMVSFVLGALVAIFFILIRKKHFGQTIPLGPFLVFGTVVSLLFGYQMFKSYVGML